MLMLKRRVRHSFATASARKRSHITIKDEVLWEFMRNENHAISPVQIGQEAARFEEYLELAGQGCGFLVVHTPEDEVAKRAVHIVMPFGLKFAEKYIRWTLEELT